MEHTKKVITRIETRATMGNNQEKWDIIIDERAGSSLNRIRELSKYKDLLFLFVKRDFIALYKQTILGPLWIVLQPLLTSIVLTVIFNYIANINTGGTPAMLFMMAGVTVWAFFSDCVMKSSETFIQNQSIFGKVYFPRLIVPLSIIATNLIKFGVQLCLFIGVYLLSELVLFPDAEVYLHPALLLLPVLVLIMAMLGLGFGLLIAALTTKYRDLRFLIQFGIQLAMYASPIVYPLNIVPEKYQWIILANPMTSIIETFKVGFFGLNAGTFNYFHLLYSAGFGIVILFIGVRLFQRVEKSFMDSI